MIRGLSNPFEVLKILLFREIHEVQLKRTFTLRQIWLNTMSCKSLPELDLHKGAAILNRSTYLLTIPAAYFVLFSRPIASIFIGPQDHSLDGTQLLFLIAIHLFHYLHTTTLSNWRIKKRLLPMGAHASSARSLSIHRWRRGTRRQGERVCASGVPIARFSCPHSLSLNIKKWEVPRPCIVTFRLTDSPFHVLVRLGRRRVRKEEDVQLAADVGRVE